MFLDQVNPLSLSLYTQLYLMLRLGWRCRFCSSPTMEEFKIKAEYSKESSMKLVENYLNNKIHSQQELCFSLTCRHFSHLLRTTKGYEALTIHRFLGQGLTNFTSLDPSKLKGREIMDIIYFFNMAYGKFNSYSYAKQISLKVSEFIAKMLQDQEMTDRKISNLIKILKCAINYRSQLFSTTVKELLTIHHQWDPFNYYNCLTIFGSNSTFQYRAQVELFNWLVKEIGEKDLLNLCGHDVYFQVLYFLTRFETSFKIETENGPVFRLLEEASKAILTQHRSLTSSEISKYLKLFSYFESIYEFERRILKALFDSIDAKGESAIDPYFIAMSLLHYEKKHKLHKIDPQWKTKIINFLTFYFSNDIFIHWKAERFHFLLFCSQLPTQQTQHLQNQKTIKGVKTLSKLPMKERIGVNLILIHESMKKYNFQTAKVLLQEKRGKEYFVRAFMNLNEQFLTDLDYSSSVENWEQFNYENYYKESQLKHGNFINFIIIENIIETVQLTLQFEQLLHIMSIPKYEDQFKEVCILKLMKISFPLSYHHHLTQLLLSLLKTTQNIIELIKNNLSAKEKPLLRCSHLQAKFIFSLMKELSASEKLYMLSFKQIAKFFMIFNPQEFFTHLITTVSQLNPVQFSQTLVQIIKYHKHNCLDQGEVDHFIQQISSLNIQSKQISQQLDGIPLNNTNLKQLMRSIFSSPDPSLISALITELNSTELTPILFKLCIRLAKYIPSIGYFLVQLLATPNQISQPYLILQVLKIFQDKKIYHPKVIPQVVETLKQYSLWRDQYNPIPAFKCLARYPKTTSEAADLLMHGIDVFKLSPEELSEDLALLYSLCQKLLSKQMDLYIRYLLKKTNHCIDREQNKAKFEGRVEYRQLMEDGSDRVVQVGSYFDLCG